MGFKPSVSQTGKRQKPGVRQIFSSAFLDAVAPLNVSKHAQTARAEHKLHWWFTERSVCVALSQRRWTRLMPGGGLLPPLRAHTNSQLRSSLLD